MSKNKLVRIRLENSEDYIYAHSYADCSGPPCPIHWMTDHIMRGMPQHWRSDKKIMERICPHGVGHDDPDEPNIGVHGCDGCCRPKEINDAE